MDDFLQKKGSLIDLNCIFLVHLNFMQTDK